MSRRPVLQVALHPLTVSGMGFVAGERVTVIANVPPRFATRHAVASSEGSFRVRFDEVEETPRRLRVRTSGSKGSAAMYSPRPARISPPTTS